MLKNPITHFLSRDVVILAVLCQFFYFVNETILCLQVYRWVIQVEDADWGNHAWLHTSTASLSGWREFRMSVSPF